nr:unnamed protein product [Callosobruchus analis]
MDQPFLYSRYSELQHADNLFVLEEYLRLLRWDSPPGVGAGMGAAEPPGGSYAVLDVGVGDGHFAVEVLVPRLPGKCERFVGVDSSEAMVTFANQHYRSRCMEFVHLDISSETVDPSLERSFDHVFSFYTLHWVKRQRQAFQNIYKLLKPGGDALLTFLATNPIYDIHQIMAKNKRWKPYFKPDYIAPYHQKKHPEKQLENILKKTGFVKYMCRVENRTHLFHGYDVLRKSIKAVNPVLSKLAGDDVDEYMNDFMDQVRHLPSVEIEKINNNEETIKIHYKLFIVYAMRPDDT